MAGWRTRERLWFISASGAHLASLIQGLWDQGKVRDCRRPAWELGIGSNSEKRGESSSCWGWYLYNDSVWGRKRNRFCWDTFLPPLCCPWVALKGWHGESLNGLCPSMCRDAPSFSLISGMSEPRPCLLNGRGIPSPRVLSLSCSLSSPSFSFWWSEPYCSPSALEECCEGTWDYNTQGQSCITVELALSSLLHFYDHFQHQQLRFLWTVVPWLFYLLKLTFCLSPFKHQYLFRLS